MSNTAPINMSPDNNKFLRWCLAGTRQVLRPYLIVKSIRIMLDNHTQFIFTNNKKYKDSAWQRQRQR